MKKIFFLLLACLLLTLPATSADGSNGLITFTGADLRQVFDVYEKLSGLELNVDSKVKQSKANITFIIDKPVSKQEAVKLFEKALEEQAHIIITKTDDKHANATLKENESATH